MSMILSSVIFGLMHAYQGLAGVIRTAATGLLLAGVFVASGSLLLSIILHVIIDAYAGALSWLARRGRRLYWLNPLAADEEYEPTARGMAAALPYLDGLFAFAGPEDVIDMAGQLRRLGAGGRVGYEFDSRDAAHRRTTAEATQGT